MSSTWSTDNNGNLKALQHGQPISKAKQNYNHKQSIYGKLDQLVILLNTVNPQAKDMFQILINELYDKVNKIAR